MSNKIFQAIDEVAPQGLEAVLMGIVNVATEEKDYSVVAEARSHLKRAELGLPEDMDDSEEWLQLLEASKEYYGEAAEAYKAEERYEEAASNFSNASRYKEAIEMYLKEGSEDSLKMVSFLAITYGVDYKLGIDLRIRRGGITRALGSISEIRDSKEEQRWGEYVIKVFYETVAEQLEKPVGGGDTRERVVDDYVFNGLVRYVERSSDPEVINIGIKLNADKLKDRHLSDGDKSRIKDTEMSLRGKLTGSDEYTDYFIQHAEESQKGNKDLVDYYAYQAVEIFEHHKKHNAALQVADRFLDPTNWRRIELLKKLGETQKLAETYKNANNPINYAMMVAESPENR